MTHKSKIQAAVVAYLQTKTWPDSLSDRIFAADSNDVKDGQCLKVTSEMQEEFPQATGNRYAVVGVELLTPVELDESLPAHMEVSIALEDAMMQDDLLAQLTTAVDDFTAMGILDRETQDGQEENFHSFGVTLRLYSCSSDV